MVVTGVLRGSGFRVQGLGLGFMVLGFGVLGSRVENF